MEVNWYCQSVNQYRLVIEVGIKQFGIFLVKCEII